MGATVLLPDAVVLPQTLARGPGIRIRDGVVEEVISRDTAGTPVGGTLLPGLVDLQVNGIAGDSVPGADHATLDRIARAVWQGGAVSFLPTLITAPFEQLLDQLRDLASWTRRRSTEPLVDHARPLGIHLEGPFLDNPGAHDEDLLLDPTAERIRALLAAAAGELRLITLSPSRPGAEPATRQLDAAGTVVALGHIGSATGFRECVAAGARLVTHLFNAMGPLHHREPTPAGLALDSAELSCTLIADGIHVHPTMVRNAFRCLGWDRTVLVTDGMAATGMPDGEYRLGDAVVYLRNGAVRDARGRLAGAALTLSQAVRSFAGMVPDAGPWVLARLAAANPAAIIGAARSGSIEAGHPARFTLWKPDGTMQALGF